MKYLYFGMYLAFLAASVSFGEEKIKPDQLDVKQFIAKMYSYDPASFDFGDFSKKDGSPFLLNRVPKNGGKYDPPKRCILLREFFDEALIIKKSDKKFISCDVEGGSRYYLDDMELSPDTRSEDIKGPEIRTPIVRGDKAMVLVFVGKKSKPDEYASRRGMNGYLLKKTDNGWRIRLTWSEIEETIREVKYSPDNRSKKLDACIFDTYYSLNEKFTMDDIWKKCK